MFIGGASGTGKSSAAYALGSFYNVTVMEADDVFQAVKAVTTINDLPAVHHWETGVNWMDIGVSGNVDWLIRASKELSPALRAIVKNHLESGMPVIIEGDFIDPEMTVAFNNPKVKSIFVHEPDKHQLVQNFLAREGGESQYFRADISVAYGQWLSSVCKKLGIPVVTSRPWEMVLGRVLDVV